jgi:type VI protein secretion system component Hcp
MGYYFYVEVKGKTQGQIKGQNPTKSQNSKIHGIQQGLAVFTPGNLAHGIRRHGNPLVIRAESAPQALHSFNPFKDRVCDEIRIKFLKSNAHGTVPSFTLTLTNATVKVSVHHGSLAKTHVEISNELTDFTLTFQTIVVENVAGSTSASDDWEAQTN